MDKIFEITAKDIESIMPCYYAFMPSFPLANSLS